MPETRQENDTPKAPDSAASNALVADAESPERLDIHVDEKEVERRRLKQEQRAKRKAEERLARAQQAAEERRPTAMVEEPGGQPNTAAASDQREVSKEYLEGYIGGSLRFNRAWRGHGPVVVVVHPAPSKNPNWTCELSAEPAEGSAQADALTQLLDQLRKRFRLRDWV